MNRKRSLTHCVALSALLLQGCTINIYHNTDSSFSESLTSAESIEPENDFSTPTGNLVKNRLRTANAAQIMTISAAPTRPLVPADGSIALEVVLSVDAYVSCFYQQDEGEIIKLFPNRVIPLYRLNSGQVLRIPGANGFRVMSSTEATKERFMCLASGEDVTPDLPLVYQANTYQQVPAENFDSLYQVYRDSTTHNLIARVLNVSNTVKHRDYSPSRSLALRGMY